jgi:hypothetical protein
MRRIAPVVMSSGVPSWCRINDEIPMTNDETNPNDKVRIALLGSWREIRGTIACTGLGWMAAEPSASFETREA